MSRYVPVVALGLTLLFLCACADPAPGGSNVVTEAGSFYGPGGEGHLRICFGAESYERIDEAMNRMQTYFESLKTQRIAS